MGEEYLVDLRDGAWDDIPTDNLGDAYAFVLLTALEPQPRRIVAVGGAPELIAGLLQKGYHVTHVDKDTAEINEIRTYLLKEVPSLLGEVRFHCCDIEGENAGEVLVVEHGDAVLFFRSLHHFENPSKTLRRVRGQLHEGWIVIVDGDTKLMEVVQDYVKEERFSQAIHAKSTEMGLADLEAAWKEEDAHHLSCMKNMERVGFLDEASVKKFLAEVGWEGSNFWYAPPCVCGNWKCGKCAYHWFAAWYKVKES